jgi:hypothetical protein
MLVPVRRAIGSWNFEDVSPQQLLNKFNGFMKSVLLRVSEARDLGDVNRYSFYEHIKTMTASPPDTTRINEKHLREYHAINCCGVIITSNHLTDGIYLPADDRRHFVAASERTQADFTPAYWNDFYRWINNGGDSDVTDYLATLDLSSFDPKAPPLKTPGFWSIVDANNAPESAELADVLDRMGRPDAVTLDRVKSMAMASSEASFVMWLGDRKNHKSISYRFEDCGYVPFRNKDAKDGQWRVNDKRQAIYTRAELSQRDRLLAARKLGANM